MRVFSCETRRTCVLYTMCFMLHAMCYVTYKKIGVVIGLLGHLQCSSVDSYAVSSSYVQ